MAKRRKKDVIDELYLGIDNVDYYYEEKNQEISLLQIILNDGEEVAREQFGDNAVDAILAKRCLVRRPIIRG